MRLQVSKSVVCTVCISIVYINEYGVLNCTICVNTDQVTKIGPGRQAGNGVAMAIQVQPGDGVKFREFAGSVVKIEGTLLERKYVLYDAY